MNIWTRFKWCLTDRKTDTAFLRVLLPESAALVVSCCDFITSQHVSHLKRVNHKAVVYLCLFTWVMWRFLCVFVCIAAPSLLFFFPFLYSGCKAARSRRQLKDVRPLLRLYIWTQEPLNRYRWYGAFCCSSHILSVFVHFSFVVFIKIRSVLFHVLHLSVKSEKLWRGGGWVNPL